MIEPFSPLSAAPPTHPMPPPVQAPSRPRLWLWVTLSAGAGFFAGAVFVVAAAMIWAASSIDTMLAVELDEPRRGVVGEPFVLSLRIGNPGSAAVNFSDIDIPDSFFDNFKVESLSPPASTDSPVGGFGTQTYYYETDLSASGKKQIDMTIVPTQPGTHTIQIDVCNGEMTCSTIWRTIDVSPGP